MANNPDREQDVTEDRQRLLKDLYRKHSGAVKMFLVFEKLTGKPLVEIAQAWEQAGNEMNSVFGVRA